jgi:hypothetical protein
VKKAIFNPMGNKLWQVGSNVKNKVHNQLEAKIYNQLFIKTARPVKDQVKENIK